MSQIITAVAFTAVSLFVAAANAGDVYFFTRVVDDAAKQSVNDNLKPTSDVNYTILDLQGNTVATDSVVLPVPQQVVVKDLAPGTYVISAETPSDGLYRTQTVEISADPEEDFPFIFERDQRDDAAVAGDVAQAQTQATSTTTTTPQPWAGQTGVVRGGALGTILGAAGLVGGIVAIATKDTKPQPVSKVAF